MEAAALGLKVEGVGDIDRAAASLDKLTSSAASAERSSGSANAEFGKLTGILADIARSVSPLSASFNTLNQTVSQQSAVLGKLESALISASKGHDTAAAAASKESSALADARKEIEALSKRVQDGESANQQYAKQLETVESRLKSQSAESNKAAKSTDQFATSIKRAAGIVATYLSAREIQQYADSWSDMTSLVKVNIGAQEDAAAVMDRLGDIARGTYSNLELTAQGFARNSFTLRALGKSTEDQLNYTEALNNALVVSGAKGQRAELVQNALGRAMAEGAAKGDDLNLVLNYGSRVAELLAAELGVNVTQLRSLAQDGKITGAVIYNSLVKNMEQLSAEAESMPATIGDAFTLMRNAVLQAVGVYDQANGISKELAESLVDVADAVRDTDWTPYINALKLAASLAAAYALAVYGATTATWLFVTAKGGATAVLAAFSAQAAVTSASLLTLRSGLSLVAAAFAGWQIGTYLRNEFEIVEKFGIALMSALHQAAVALVGVFDLLGENISFALTNPLDFARGKIADFLEWTTSLGAGALKFLGLEGLADGIKTEFSDLRGENAAQHAQALQDIRENTRSEMNAVGSIYRDMFNEVGKSAEAVKSISAETLGGTAEEAAELTEAQKALASSFEQMLSQYHRQITLSADATEQEQLLYEIQHGRLQGLLPLQQEMLEGMANEIDLRNSIAKAAGEQKDINRDRDAISRELMSEEERIIESYARRRDIVMSATFENEQARTELLLRLEQERNEMLLEENGSYWERWLIGAEESLTNFNEIAGSVVEGFSSRFGDAFESMIFDAETLGDAVQGMAEGMLRSVVNAIGQMIAQELAYQAVLAFRGQIATASAATEIAATAATTTASVAATATTTTAQVAAATTTAAAWTPAAFMASIGSFGAAAAIGIGAVIALGALGGFQQGGYTGNGGVSDIAGVVHGKEYVMDAATTARIGVSNLDAMSAGRALPTNVVPFAQPVAMGGGAPIINVYNNDNTRADVTTSQNDQGQDVIDIVVQNLLTDGDIAGAVNRITGTQYQGA